MMQREKKQQQICIQVICIQEHGKAYFILLGYDKSVNDNFKK